MSIFEEGCDMDCEDGEKIRMTDRRLRTLLNPSPSFLPNMYFFNAAAQHSQASIWARELPYATAVLDSLVLAG
jgi:hypothetical protein